MSFTTNCKEVPAFESARLLFKLARDKDRNDLLTLHRENFEQDYIKSAWGVPPHLVTQEMCDQFINKKIDRNESQCKVGFSKVYTLFFAIYRKKDQKLIGAIELYVTKDKKWEIGLFIDKNNKNLGFATEATKAFIEFAKRDTDIGSIIFSCRQNNLASIKVAEKCGFRKFNTYVLYQGCSVDEFEFDLKGQL